MLTKYILTIGTTEYEIPDECLKNWDEIAFSLKRTDYSGVMRSFSTEFVFVGDIKDLLWDAYLTDGLLTSASIAVYTITNKHEWVLQFASPMDFSTIETDEGTLTINAMDNALASLLKSKMSQKYEFQVSDFESVEVLFHRILMKNVALFTFDYSDIDQPLGQVNLTYNEKRSVIISEEYLSMCDEVNDTNPTGKPVNRFFATCNKYGASLKCTVKGTVRCFFGPSHFGLGITADTPVQRMELVVLTVNASNQNVESVENILFTDNILSKTINGVQYNMFINGSRSNGFDTFQDMTNYIASQHITLYDGMFGVVGTGEYGYQQYWSNTVYEYHGGRWLNKGAAGTYYQDRTIAANYTIVASDSQHEVHLPKDANVQLRVASSNVTNGKMHFMFGSMEADWEDPLESGVVLRGITPQELVSKIVSSITGENTTVTIEQDTAGLIEHTLLFPAEELRQISGAKIYSSFKFFVDWIETVFGYTYRVVGDTLQFVHRSEVFVNTVSKVIDSFRDLKYSIEDGLIYTGIDAGYSKKEYGEIDGRLETNFTNYYSTGYSLTDNRLQLISKYRADSYGVEFMLRKWESKGETTDDKADEDVFFINFITNDDINIYRPSYQDAYMPSVCVNNNKGFIAVMGGGAAMMLTMTSSDGNNVLTDINIPADTALFTVGEIEFSTDDMELPNDLNALVQLEHNGFRYKGFIKEAEFRYGRRNGVEYKLIVQEITAL